MTTEDKGLLIKISILQEFALNIETEKKLYDQMFKNALQEAKAIRDKYKYSLKIEEFLQSLSKLDEEEQIREKYDNFINQEIDNGMKFGDVFDLDIDSIVKEKKISYGIRLNKVNTTLFLPAIGTLKLYQATETLKLISEKVITGAIQIFEKYFERLLWRLITIKPEAYLHDKVISYDKLISSDLQKLKNQLIGSEVEKLMHGVSETISKINKIHKLHLENFQDLWDSYIEMDLHRNIIVHNNGKVNKDYLDAVPNKYKNVKIGEQIKCDRKIIEQKTNNLIKFGYLLFYLLGESSNELTVLEDTAFDFLQKEQWELAEFAYELLEKTKLTTHANKLNYVINKLNSKKHIYGLETVRKEIEDLDISGMQQLYEIAKNLLLENNDKVTEELEKCYPDTYNSYLICTWPIFIEYRKTKEYKDFQEKHKEDFEAYEFNANK